MFVPLLWSLTLHYRIGTCVVLAACSVLLHVVMVVVVLEMYDHSQFRAVAVDYGDDDMYVP